ncbi:LacI family DNA-binding transcriptional regulator [Agathobaculum sp. NTUH-O15-33]|uniref:LacI family DNA-binding transcriptional regulator n=1 Tax=Agathobaculum sp. NTUH-O15-33 TaxID=3079302 RepID=UPI00295845C2|nr:LacI family DNA-binding transcriptional regulator [Agathobaculum sp. NTUH-O15-33]WNX83274.1 LacI family DNA-binding transcriptional regulator [Agathobaculum sp. NTUH-O15-33]
MANITISEIAREAGVSKSTVSRVLNSKPDVLPETKQRVMEIVEKYGFQPSVYAISMSQKRCNCIGVVIPHDIDYIFKNQYYSEIQRTMLKAAQKRGYYVLLLCCKDMKEAINAVKQRRVDGLIMVSPLPEHKSAMTTFLESNIPFVTVGKCQFLSNAYQVCTDNYKGAMLAMEHLLGLGHRRIAYINGPHFLPSSGERCRAYLDAMRAENLPVTEGMIREGGNSIESGYAATKEILSDHPDITALFVASDYMAIGVESAVRDSGMRVPDDISIVSFDNIPIAAQISPALTTVDQHIEEKGQLCVDLLLDLLEEPNTQRAHSIDIAPTLCVRESTSKVRS